MRGQRSLGLLAVCCAAVGLYAAPSRAATVVATVQAENMTLPSGAAIVSDSTASGGRYVRFRTSGSATGTLTTTAKTNKLRVRASGIWCSGAPKLVVKVDGTPYWASVATASWATLSFAVPLQAGSHPISVALTNPYQQAGCTRQLNIDVLRAVETTSSAPPAPQGYFTSLPAGAWSSLPGDSQCAKQVHRSTWEPRPENYTQNHTKPDPTAVHNSFAKRPRSSGYNAHWNNWLLPRVDGQFTGTTDEIIQWAACKWGIADNILRAQAVEESTWYQGLHYSDGQCYWTRGCGDAFSKPTSASTTYCNGLARFGHDYQKDTNSTYGAYPWNTPMSGMCPKTFSIIGVMSWDDPAWESPNPPYSGDQNGTFPFNRNSTAFALDYEASFLRGCDEGWISWLPSRGHIWGCVGSWFSGDWLSTGANQYISRVQKDITNHIWLTANFADGRGNQYECDPVKKCPH